MSKSNTSRRFLKQKNKFIVAIIFFAFCFKKTNAAEFFYVSEISVLPEYSTSQSPYDSSFSNESSVFVFAKTRFNLSEKEFSFEIQPEIRAVLEASNLSSNAAGSIMAPPRLMNLNWILGSNRNSQTIVGIERLNFSYQFKSLEMSVGRKPVSLGVLSVFPVWNKFTRPLITNFGPLLIFSQDQVSFHSQVGEFGFQAIDIEQNNSSNAARLGEVAWYGDGLELHLLGGSWWQAGSMGFAAIKDLGGTSLRLETISFSGEGVQAGFGLERAFSEFWSTLLEFLYLQNGATNKSQYLTLSPSLFRPLSAQDYGYARIEYKPWPLWTVQFGDLFNFIDSSQLLNGKITYSVGNEAELTFEYRVPYGADLTELSAKILPSQFIGGCKYTF